MKILPMTEEIGQKKLQALVSEGTAEEFQVIIKKMGLTQEKALGFLVELYIRMPQPQQGTLSFALRDEPAFLAFMQAVDSVIGQAISSRLKNVGGPPEVEELRGRIAVLEGTSRSRRQRKVSRGEGG